MQVLLIAMAEVAMNAAVPFVQNVDHAFEGIRVIVDLP